MVKLGAKGLTHDQIHTAFETPLQPDYIKYAMKTLLPQFLHNKNFFLQLGARIFAPLDTTIKQEFTLVAEKIFFIEVKQLDFQKPEAAAVAINVWVQQQTNKKIQEVILPTGIKPTTKMLLVDAVYVSGAWTKPFQKNQTVKSQFYKTPDDVVTAEMMGTCERFFYCESETLDAKFLKMSILGSTAFMVVVLPNKRDGLKALEQKVEDLLVEQKLNLTLVDVNLPKFRVETRSSFVPVLRQVSFGRSDLF